MHMASQPKLMGKFVVSARTKLLGWLATAVMALAVMVLAWLSFS